MITEMDRINCDLENEVNVESADGEDEGSSSDESEEEQKVTKGINPRARLKPKVQRWETHLLEHPEELQTNLKSLHIVNEKSLTRQISLTSFLAHFPNLEEMEIASWHAGCTRASDYVTNKLWEALNNCRRTNKTRLNIKKLDVMHLCQDAVDSHRSRSLSSSLLGGPSRFISGGRNMIVPDHGGSSIDIGDCTLPLEHLSIDVGYSGTKTNYLDYVIESHAATLQVLKLFRAPFANSELGLPTDFEMPALKELYLYGDLVTTFCFLETMPNLRVLCIERWCYTKRDKLKKQKEKPSKNMNHLLVQRSIKKNLSLDLKYLEELDIDTGFDLGSINALAGWVPNLKIAQLILTNETLDAVIKGWPGLTELTVKFESDVDDEGIKKLVGLKHLRKFKLEAYCNKSQLTDESAETFVSMCHLKDLEICVSEQMSEKSERRLKSKLRNVKIVRNYGERDHEYECCSRVEFHKATRSSVYNGRCAAMVVKKKNKPR